MWNKIIVFLTLQILFFCFVNRTFYITKNTTWFLTRHNPLHYTDTTQRRAIKDLIVNDI